jgi:hypothetical protein
MTSFSRYGSAKRVHRPGADHVRIAAKDLRRRRIADECPLDRYTAADEQPRLGEGADHRLGQPMIPLGVVCMLSDERLQALDGVQECLAIPR